MFERSLALTEKMRLKDYTLTELETFFETEGQKKYRAKQVFKWLHRGVVDFEEMTDLSKELRGILQEKCIIGFPIIKQKLVSQKDGTVKYLLQFDDGNFVETVMMRYEHGNTLCISTQVGCKMGCHFCASTIGGLVRHLKGGEILDQILCVQKDLGERISNVVMMGIGEPLDNYNHVIKFLKNVNAKEGLNIGYRHITLSTCGLVPKMIKLSEENMPITLSVSLHAPNDDIRNKIMPINTRFSIDKILQACKIYIERTKRRITFEYAMIDGMNDSKNNAEQLVSKIKPLQCHVNLIPVNQVDGRKFNRSSKQNVEAFRWVLEKAGIPTTVRRELGGDINASCGQLRRGYV